MAHLFIYTRLEKFDYRVLYAPDNQTLSGNMRNEFISFAREVINSDNFGDIQTPRYAMIKRGQKILVGIGCDTSIFGVQESTTETRRIRGFFGVFLENCSKRQLNTLSQIRFYQNLFETYVKPLWSLNRKEESKTNSVVQSINIEDSLADMASDSHTVCVNTSSSVCEIFPNTIKSSELLASCILAENSDIVTSLNSDAHILNAPLYHFHNATIVGILENYTIKFASTSPKNKEGENISRFEHNRKSATSEWGENSPIRTRKKSSTRLDSDDGCISKIISKLISWMASCGINPKKFITLLADRFNLSVVDKNDHISPIESPLESDVTHFSVRQAKVVESDHSEELVEFADRRTNRKSAIASLQQQFRDKNQTTTVGETDNIVDLSVDNKDKSELTDYQDNKSLRIEDIDVDESK